MAPYHAHPAHPHTDDVPLFLQDKGAHPTVTSSISSHPRQHAWWIRTGRENLVFLFLGWAVILTALSMLIFLWAGDDHNSTWSNIITGSRATQMVTICSAVIRSAVGIQAGILTAAIASLLLERCGVSVGEAAHLSIARASTVAPHNIALATLSINRPVALSTVLKIGIVLSVAVTVLSQFISTVLLADFGDMTILGNTSSVDMLYSSSFYPAGINSWTSRPYSFPRFAEYAEPPVVQEGDGFVDTNHVYRAFLPIDSAADRSSLRTYNGPAPIMDARVACVRPEIVITNLTGTWKEQRGSTYEVLILYGTVAIKEDYPILSVSGAQSAANKNASASTSTSPTKAKPAKFTCLLSIAKDDTRKEWQTSICHIEMSLDFRTNSSLNAGRMDAEAEQFLLLNTTGTSRQWIDKSHSTDRIYNWDFSPNGVWTTAKPKQDALSVSLSLCISKPISGDYLVSLSSDTDGPEPNTGIDTESLRRQLGATNTTHTADERAIFALPPPSTWKKPNTTTNVQYGTKAGWDLPTFHDYNFTPHYAALLLAEHVSVPQQLFVIHFSHVALFQDVLRTTRNPALALQAVLTVLASSRYYDSFYAFSRSAPATLSFSRQVLGPVRWTGLVGVLVVVVVHALLLVVFMALFVGKTSCSTIGNAWQAVAQAVSEDTREVVERTADMSSREARAWMKWSNPGNGMRLRIKRSGVDGRSEMGHM